MLSAVAARHRTEQASLRSAQAKEVLAEAGANQRAGARAETQQRRRGGGAAEGGQKSAEAAPRGSAAALCADLSSELEAVKAERDALRRALAASRAGGGGGPATSAGRVSGPAGALLRESLGGGESGGVGSAASRLAAAAVSEAEAGDGETPGWVLQAALLEARRDADRMREDAHAARANAREEARRGRARQPARRLCDLLWREQAPRERGSWCLLVVRRCFIAASRRPQADERREKGIERLAETVAEEARCGRLRAAAFCAALRLAHCAGGLLWHSAGAGALFLRAITDGGAVGGARRGAREAARQPARDARCPAGACRPLRRRHAVTII